MKENKGRMSRNKNVSMYVGAFNIIMPPETYITFCIYAG